MLSEVIIRFLDVFAVNEPDDEVADLPADGLPESCVWRANDLVEEHDAVLDVRVHEPEVEQHVPHDHHRRELPVVLGRLHWAPHCVITVKQDRVRHLQEGASRRCTVGIFFALPICFYQ